MVGVPFERRGGQGRVGKRKWPAWASGGREGSRPLIPLDTRAHLVIIVLVLACAGLKTVDRDTGAQVGSQRDPNETCRHFDPLLPVLSQRGLEASFRVPVPSGSVERVERGDQSGQAMTMAAGRIGRLVGGCVPIISRVLKRGKKVEKSQPFEWPGKMKGPGGGRGGRQHNPQPGLATKTRQLIFVQVARPG